MMIVRVSLASKTQETRRVKTNITPFFSIILYSPFQFICYTCPLLANPLQVFFYHYHPIHYIIIMQPPEIVAAYPNPPPFYKLYANYKPNGDYGPDEKQPPPPPPPPEGTYKMFGLTYTVWSALTEHPSYIYCTPLLADHNNPRQVTYSPH